MKRIKIVPVGVGYVWDHLMEGFEINMVDEDNVVYYLNGYAVEQVAKWINEVIEGERAAAFFFLESDIDYAAE